MVELQELKDHLLKIDEYAEKQKIDVISEYCLSLNSLAVGDIFTDHIGSILVDKISPCILHGEHRYCCSYTGVALTKKMVPNKSGTRRKAYSINQQPAGE